MSRHKCCIPTHLPKLLEHLATPFAFSYPLLCRNIRFCMDAFTTIVDLVILPDDIVASATTLSISKSKVAVFDAPVDAESTKSSNGGGCTVAHKPVIDAPVDAESTKSSNGGGCIVA